MTEIPTSYGNLPQSDFESQFRRVFEAAGCRTQVELADFLEIKQSSISDAKRRKAIPAEWLIKILDKKDIPPDWIRTGKGRKKSKISSKNMPSEATQVGIEFRPAHDCPTEELLIELVKRLFKR